MVYRYALLLVNLQIINKLINFTNQSKIIFTNNYLLFILPWHQFDFHTVRLEDERFHAFCLLVISVMVTTVRERWLNRNKNIFPLDALVSCTGPSLELRGTSVYVNIPPQKKNDPVNNEYFYLRMIFFHQYFFNESEKIVIWIFIKWFINEIKSMYLIVISDICVVIQRARHH